jgi:hypothetical protein
MIVQLQTRSGRNIPNEQRMPLLGPNSMRMEEQACKDMVPGIVTQSLCNLYNCAGMVFANRRTTVDDLAFLYTILSDDHYRQIAQNETVPGDVVIYRGNDDEITHVGLIHWPDLTNATFIVRSQWGNNGEYLHDLDRVPWVYGRAAEFWTERIT